MDQRKYYSWALGNHKRQGLYTILSSRKLGADLVHPAFYNNVIHKVFSF